MVKGAVYQVRREGGEGWGKGGREGVELNRRRMEFSQREKDRQGWEPVMSAEKNTRHAASCLN